MSRMRVNVERGFHEAKLYSTTVDLKRKMCMAESPVGTLYFAAMSNRKSRYSWDIDQIHFGKVRYRSDKCGINAL